MQVKIELMSHAVAAPHYQTTGSAGCDLLAAIMAPGTIGPGERALVPTGIRIELPPGYEAQVRPRSGLALKHGVTVLNAPGTIDSDYRGEIGVILVNLGRERYVVRRGDRVAQLVIAPVVQAEWELGRVSGSARGDNGYGSTGT